MEDFEIIDKLTSLDTSTLADKNYDVRVDTVTKADTGPMCIKQGWDMLIFNYKPLTIIEIGDYSMLVKESYTPYKVTDVKGNKVVESITTSEGTILYFSNKLPEELKHYNVIYAKLDDWTPFTYSDIIEAYKSSTYLSDTLDKLTKEINNGESK